MVTKRGGFISTFHLQVPAFSRIILTSYQPPPTKRRAPPRSRSPHGPDAAPHTPPIGHTHTRPPTPQSFAFMSLRLCKPPLSTALKLSIKNMHQTQKYADMLWPHRRSCSGLRRRILSEAAFRRERELLGRGRSHGERDRGCWQSTAPGERGKRARVMRPSEKAGAWSLLQGYSATAPNFCNSGKRYILE